jgi:hypothetical protein
MAAGFAHYRVAVRPRRMDFFGQMQSFIGIGVSGCGGSVGHPWIGLIELALCVLRVP